MKNEVFLSAFLAFLIVTSLTFGQRLTGEKREIKESIANYNEITTIMYNYGSVCRPNTFGNIADLVWNDLGYMFEFGPLLSAEVIDTNNNIVHITSDSFVLTGQGDYDSIGVQKWGWLPRAGYANPNSNEIANYLDANSWPDTWTAWPGEYGENVAIAENEYFYVMDDFSNAEFNYFPFEDDADKRGLGVSAEVRVYQFSGFLKDALIIKYKIKNESPKDLTKVYFGFHVDPHIGGASDYGDDRAGFIAKDYEIPEAANTIYNYDEDGIGMGGKTTGYLGYKLIKTPNDLGLTSLHIVRYTNSDPNVPRNDPLMWQWLSADSIDLDQTLLNTAGDNINNFGTGPFELKAGETQEISLAIFLSENYDDMLRDAFAIQHYINWPSLNNNYAAQFGDENYKIELNEPAKENNGDIVIGWNYTGTDPNAKVFIDYSSDGGVNWTPIIKDYDISSSFIWDTKNVNDGVNYILRVLAYDSENPVTKYYYDNCNERFSINNPEKNSLPEFTFIENSDTLEQKFVKIEWISEDVDNNEHSIFIEHTNTDETGFKKIYEAVHTNGKNSFMWDISSIPNYNQNRLRFTIKDNENVVVSVSNNFVIDVKEVFNSSTQIVHAKGSATAEIRVEVVDSADIKNAIYEITFSKVNEIKKYSIANKTTEQMVFENVDIIDGMSTPTFDGLRFNIKDNEMDIDRNKTHFNRTELETTYNVFYSVSNSDYIGNPHVKSDLDWVIIFNDLDTNSDGTWKNIAETALAVPSMQQANCPFKIVDIVNNEKANYIIDESRFSQLNNKQWDIEEKIILQKQIPASAAEVTYALQFDFSSGTFPQKGDTLYIITYNSITDEDVYRFSAYKGVIISNEDKVNIPDKFALYQNYPNPFNPSTTIKYSIAANMKDGVENVKLVVFDILGREVTTLVNRLQKAGNYEVIFNASSLSSGVYFYRLQSGSFVDTKKLMLLR